MMQHKKSGIFHWLIPFLLLAAGIYLVPVKIFKSDFSKVPGDYGDARFNNYILEHGYRYITGKTDRYWDAPFLFPYKNTIALSDNLLGTVPVYSVFRIAGYDRETAYQLWLLTMFMLNYLCCFFVLNKWFGHPILGSVGAYIFAFSIFILGNIYNVQTFPRFIVPFVFYWTWKYLSERNIKYFLFISLGVVFQFYCGIYLGFFLLYSLLCMVIAYLIIYRDKIFLQQFTEKKALLRHVSVLLLAAGLMAPLMIPYVEISARLGMRQFEDALSSIPTMRSYFFTDKGAALWRGLLSEHGKKVLKDWWCHFLFVGAIPWLGIISIPFVLFSKKVDSMKKRFLSFLFLSFSLSFIFCLRINNFSLYRLVFYLPGFSSMRSINRVLNTEIMFFILISLTVFSELSKMKTGIKCIIMTFPFLIIIDNLIDSEEVMRYNKGESQAKIEEVKKNISSNCNNESEAVAYMPGNSSESQVSVSLDVMLAAQELGVKCVNAYTGSYPGEFNDFVNRGDYESLIKWCKFNNCDEKKIDKIYIEKNGIAAKHFYMKAFNDKYLCCDLGSNNLLVANRPVAALWETFSLAKLKSGEFEIYSFDNKEIAGCPFQMVRLKDNFFVFKSENGNYLGINKNSFQLSLIASTIGETEKFRIEFL